MTTETAVAEKPKTNPATLYRQQVSRYAGAVLSDWVGEERAREATGRIAAAMSASAAASKDPSEFYKCTPQSVATCIAVAALTGIMPSTGSSALAYVVPQRPRQGEPPQLQYMLSHRGINALARRSGQTMIPIPISHKDTIEVSDDGEVTILSRDVDNPPMNADDLRGVVVMVKQLDTGNITCRGWVPKKLIEARKGVSRSAKSEYSPWSKWYVEMAMKTGMHYAISRGWCVIDDTEAVRALSVDAESDLDQPVLPAPVAESRSDAVANLLMEDVPADVVRPSTAEPATNEEIGVTAEIDDAKTLENAFLNRIADLETPEGSQDIACDLDEANREKRLDLKTIRQLQKALNARCEALSAPAEQFTLGAKP